MLYPRATVAGGAAKTVEVSSSHSFRINLHRAFRDRPDAHWMRIRNRWQDRSYLNPKTTRARPVQAATKGMSRVDVRF